MDKFSNVDNLAINADNIERFSKEAFACAESAAEWRSSRLEPVTGEVVADSSWLTTAVTLDNLNENLKSHNRKQQEQEKNAKYLKVAEQAGWRIDSYRKEVVGQVSRQEFLPSQQESGEVRAFGKKIIDLLVGAKSPLRLFPKSQDFVTERDLIQYESEVGRSIFGELPDSVVRREFFNLDTKTWIWYEVVRKADGSEEELTTRYEVQPQGILKVQPNCQYHYLEGDELINFVLATERYCEQIARQVYRKDPQYQRAA